MRRPKVSILTPVFNNLRFARALRESLIRHTHPDCYELILIDNGSTEAGMDEFYDLVRGPGCTVIRNGSNLGFGRANNIGLAGSSGEFVTLLNSDMLVTSGWLEPLISAFDRYPRCGAIQSKIILIGDGPPRSWKIQTCGAVFDDRGLPSYQFSGQDPDAPDVTTPLELQAFMGTGVTIRRAVVEETGFFNEQYDLVFMEDTDLSLRISERGYRIRYEPASLLYHFHGASMPHLSREDYDRSRNANLQRFRSIWPAHRVFSLMQSLGFKVPRCDR